MHNKIKENKMLFNYCESSGNLLKIYDCCDRLYIVGKIEKVGVMYYVTINNDHGDSHREIFDTHKEAVLYFYGVIHDVKHAFDMQLDVNYSAYRHPNNSQSDFLKAYHDEVIMVDKNGNDGELLRTPVVFLMNFPKTKIEA